MQSKLLPVHQIWISDSEDPPPSFVQGCMESIQQIHSESKYTLWNKETLREFVHSLAPEIGQAYDNLTPYTYKADLGKYCLMYALGGWYYDSAVRSIAILDVPDFINCIAYSIEEENQCWTPMAIQTSVMYSHPENIVYRYAIELILENVKNRYYGETTFCPTGPNVLGRAFARFYAENGTTRKIIFGKLRRLTPGCINQNGAFVLPDGTIHALMKPGGTDLKDYGAKGTNTYTEYWKEGRVYR